MKLYLHIGAEKTGTTSVQTFLNANRSKLCEQGFYVPKSLGSGSHRWLPVLAYKPDRVDEFIREQGLLDNAVRNGAVENRLQLFNDEMQGVSEPYVILTSEHLQSRLTTIEEVENLHKIVERFFSSIDIIFYLRDPFSMAVSLYSTSLRAGGVTKDIFGPKEHYIQNTANYRKTISIWENVFGSQNIVLRLYEKDYLFGGDIVTDFCKAVGIRVENLHIPGSQNSSLSVNALQILREFNEICKNSNFDNYSIAKARKRVVEILEKHFSDLRPFRGSLETQGLYQIEFEESIKWVHERYFPDRDRLFSVAPVRSEGHWPLEREPGRSIANSYIDLLMKKES